MILHKIEEVRVYCGPAALMAISGQRLPEVRAVVNKIRGRKHNQGICGMYNSEIDQALKDLGFKYQYRESSWFPKLSKYEFKPNTRYLINVTGHYLTYCNGVIIDNHYRFGTTMDECKWANKKVKRVWRINKVLDNL